MIEFTIGEHNYRTNRKLDPFEQLDVARKLAPLIAKLASRLAFRAASTQEGDDATGFFSLMEPVIQGLAEMQTVDVNHVTQLCVSVVQRQQGQQWAPIWNSAAKRLMFNDDSIDAMALLQISWQVIQENLGNFMRAPSSVSPSPTQTDIASQGNLSAFPMGRIG